MKHIWVWTTTLVVLTCACSFFSINPPVGLTESVQLPTLVVPSQTILPTQAPIVTPPPVIPPAIPPVPTNDGAYQLKKELIIGVYAVRQWTNPNSQIGFDDVVTIDANGQPQIRIDMVFGVDSMTGTDINGDSYHEVIVETYSGGSHCCFGTLVYSLRAVPNLILQKPESNAGGSFRDLNVDGIYEFDTADDLFAYVYCPYAGSPFVRVIMAYDPQQNRYTPASPHFADWYAPAIAEHTAQADTAKSGELGEWDNTTKCSVLSMVMDYLYIGQTEKARTELLRLYPYPDVENFWNEIYQLVQQSSLYTPQ